MGLVHALADGRVVASFECVANVEYALRLAYDETCPPHILLRDVGCRLTEHIHVGIAQITDLGVAPADDLHDALARLAAFVVGRVDQLVLDGRVDEHQTVAVRLGVEREVAELHRAAVETHQVSGLAEDRGELIHYAAVDAAVVVFGRLAYARQLEAVDAQREELVECIGERRFERCRRRHAGAQRHIARECRIETGDAAAAFLYLAAYAEYIACPALRGRILLAESELGIVVEIDRHGPYAVGAVGAYLGHHALVYGAGEDEASVVVGVLADKVDAAGV